jgi:hypothetical protein
MYICSMPKGVHDKKAEHNTNSDSKSKSAKHELRTKHFLTLNPTNQYVKFQDKNKILKKKNLNILQIRTCVFLLKLKLVQYQK